MAKKSSERLLVWIFLPPLIDVLLLTLFEFAPFNKWLAVQAQYLLIWPSSQIFIIDDFKQALVYGGVQWLLFGILVAVILLVRAKLKALRSTDALKTER